MTHASTILSVNRGARQSRLRVDPSAIVAAVFFLAVCAAEMALIWRGASEIDPTSLMGFVT
jgi:hypothetical protein